MVADRQRWAAVLARASGAAIAALLAEAPPLPAHRRLRGPETGLVMVRGRAGGTGQAFNLGEMTATRCSVVMEGGAAGHAMVAGRDGRHAELAAVLDAAAQDAAWREAVEGVVIGPLAAAQAAARERTARKAAATRVQFFTLATMRS